MSHNLNGVPCWLVTWRAPQRLLTLASPLSAGPLCAGSLCAGARGQCRPFLTAPWQDQAECSPYVGLSSALMESTGQTAPELMALNADIVAYRRLLAENPEATTGAMEEYRHCVGEHIASHGGPSSTSLAIQSAPMDLTMSSGRRPAISWSIPPGTTNEDPEAMATVLPSELVISACATRMDRPLWTI